MNCNFQNAPSSLRFTINPRESRPKSACESNSCRLYQLDGDFYDHVPKYVLFESWNSFTLSKVIKNHHFPSESCRYLSALLTNRVERAKKNRWAQRWVRNNNATFTKFNMEINYQSFALFYLSDYYYLILMFTFPYNPFYPVMYIM